MDFGKKKKNKENSCTNFVCMCVVGADRKLKKIYAKKVQV